MKTPLIPIAHRRNSTFLFALAAALAALSPAAHGGVISKAANTTPLNNPASWVGGNVPGPTDTALWDSTLPGSNASQLGGNSTWNGIAITNPGGAITILGNATVLLSLGGGGVDMSNAEQNLTMAGVPLNFAANQTWNIAAGRIMTSSGATSSAGGFGLTKIGGGQLNLNGNNSFSGGININGGTLSLGGASALLTGNINLNTGTLIVANANALGSSNLTINDGTFLNTAAAAITVAGVVTQTWNGNFTFLGNNTLNMGTGTVTLGSALTLTVNASTLTIGGVISGSSALTKAGAGTLVLAGANLMTGPLNLDAGTLNINNVGALGTSTLTIGDGTAINNGSGGAITLSTVAPQVWNGNFTFVGTNSLGTGTGGVSLTGARTVTVTASTLTVGGVISGAGGSIIKAGNGALTLAGANTFDGGVTLLAGQVNIANASALGTGTFTINGGSFNNTSGNATTLTTNNPQVWNGDFTFIGQNSFGLGTGAVTMTGNRTVTVNATNLTVSGVISGTGFGITKAGAGGLVLAGANTFDGGINLTAGSLGINHAQALGTGTLIINGGAINNSSGAAVTVSTANPQSWLSDVTFIGTNSLNLGTGPVTLGDNRTVTVNANTLTVGGIISGSGLDLTKMGAGALVLSANNLYTGNTTVLGGTLTLAGNNAYSGSTVVSGATLILGGQNAFTPATSVTNGALVLDFSSPGAPVTNILPATSALLLGGTSNLTLIGGSGLANSQTFATTTLSSGLATVNLNLNSATSLGVNFGAITRDVGSLLIPTNAPSGTLTYATSTGTANSILASADSTPYVIIGGTDWGAKDATNTIIVGLSTIAGGYTNTTANSLVGNADVAAGVTTTVLSANTVISSLRYNVDQATTINLGGNTLGVGGILMSSAVNTAGSLIESGFLTSAGTGGDIVVYQNSAQPLVINATIANNITAVGLTKGGNGILQLNAPNTFSGNTTIIGGTIALGNSLALQNSPVSVFGGSLNFGNLTEATVGGLGGSGAVLLDNAEGAPMALTINTLAGVDVTLSGVISGNGTLAKTGNGALTLSGNNAFASGINLNGGILRINSPTAIGSGTLIIAGPSTLDNSSGAAVTLSTNNLMEWNADFSFGGTNALNMGTGAVTLGGNRLVTVAGSSLTIGGVISGASTITKAGNGNLELTAANLYTGGTTLQAGTITLGTATSLGTGPITVSGGNFATTAAVALTNALTVTGDFGKSGANPLTIDSGFVLTGNRSIFVEANTFTIGGAITGAGFGITKNGNGQLNITNANNNYDGGLLVNAGTVNIGTNGAGTGIITLNGGGVQIASNSTITNSFVISNSGTINAVMNNGQNSNFATANNAFTGNGTIILNITGGNGGSQITMSGNNALGVFGGTLQFAATSIRNLRIYSGDGVGPFGNSNLTVDFVEGTTSSISFRNANQVFIIGALTGNAGFLNGNNNGRFIIGGKNLSTTYGGQINNANSVIKVGTGTLTLTNSGSNYTGVTTITSGTLEVGNGGATGVLGLTSSVVNNSVLAFNRNNTVTFNTAIGGSGSLEQRGSGQLDLVGSNSFAGPISINGGTLSVAEMGNAGTGFTGTSAAVLAPVTSSAGATLTMADTTGINVGDFVTGYELLQPNTTVTAVNPGNVVLSTNPFGAITNVTLTFSGNTITVPDASIFTVGQTVSGANIQAFSTVTGIDLGNNTLTLSLPVSGAGANALVYGSPTSLGLSSSANSNLVLNGGSLQYTGPATSSDRAFTLGSQGGGFDASGSGTLDLTNTGTVATAGTNSSPTFVLSGNNTGNNTLNATIVNDGSGQTSVTKNGTGTWVLTANSTYSGPTTVNNGVLRVNASLPNTSVTVTGGTFTGNVTIGGTLTVNTGGTVAPGTGVGNLTAASVVLGSGSVLNFEFSNVTTYDQIIQVGAGGNVTLNGGGINIYSEGTTNDWTQLGTYNLFQYNGTLIGDVANLSVLNDDHVDLNYAFNNDVTNKLIQLIITQAVVPFAWNLTGGGNWNVANNWSTNVVPNGVGANASFLSSISANSTVVVDAPITVGTITFSSGFSYDIAPGAGSLTLDNGASPAQIIVGTSSHIISTPLTLTAMGLSTNISGPTALTISGGISESAPGAAINMSNNGLLSLAGANSFTGGVFLNSGTLQVQNSSNLGALSSPLVFNGGTLRWASGSSGDISDHTLTFMANAVIDTNGNTVTLANSIGNNGAGALVKIGNGILSLGGANTYTGGTRIDVGTIELNSAANFGTGGITFNGGTLQWKVGSTADISSVPMTFNGSNNANLAVLADQSVTLSGAIGNGSTGRVVKWGEGTLELAGINTYTGGTTVRQGTLAITSDLNLGPVPPNTPGSINLNGGALMALANLTINVNRGISVGPVEGGTGNGTISVTEGIVATYAGAIANGSPVTTGRLIKEGLGQLNMSAGQTYTGGTELRSGTLNLTAGGLGTGGVIFNGGTLQLSANLAIGGTINVLSTGTLVVTVAGGGFTSNVTGSGILSLNGSTQRIDFGNNTNLNGFNGTIDWGTSGASIRGFAGSVSTFGNVTVDLGTNDANNLNSRDNQNMNIGALTGNGSVSGSATYNIGSKNLDTVFNGTILTGGTAVNKVGTGRFTMTSDGSTFGGVANINNGTLQLGNGGETGSFGENTAGANIASTGTLTFNRSGETFTSHPIGGVGILQQTGPGMVVLTGNNNFAGTINVTGGTLAVEVLTTDGLAFNATNVAPVILSSTVADGSTLVTVPSTTGLFVGMTVGGNGDIPGGTRIVAVDAGNNTITLSQAADDNITGENITFAGRLTVDDASLFEAGDSLGGNTSLNPGATVFAVDVGSNSIFPSNIPNGTDNVLALAAASPNGLGVAPNDATNLVLNGGNLGYVGADDLVTNRAFTLGIAGGGLDSSGGGTFTYSNSGNIVIAGTDTARTFNLSGSNTGDNTFAYLLGDNGTGATSLSKTGSGTWILTADSTYTGTTSVANGSLIINGNLSTTALAVSGGNLIANAPMSASANVTGGRLVLNNNLVGSANVTGNGTLTGPGSLVGALNASANGTVSPGTGVGNITVATAILGEGANLTIEFETGSNDLLVVTGLDGLSLTGNVGVNLFQNGTTNPWTNTGNYNIVQFNGNVTGNVADLFAVNAGSVFPGLVYNFDSSGGFLRVLISLAPEPTSWNVAGGGNWSVLGNWFSAIPNAAGTIAYFPAVITANSTVNVNANFTVGGMQFSSGLFDYTVAGTGGTLTLDNVADPAEIRIVLGNATISAPLALNTNLSANIAAGSVLTLSGNIGENVSGQMITMSNPGTLQLLGENSYSGGTVLDAGTIVIGNTAASLGQVIGTNLVTFNGGTLRWASGSTADISVHTLFFQSNATLDTNGNNVTFANSIGGSGSGALIKTGNGVLALEGFNAYFGGTFVNGGFVQFSTVDNLPGQVTLNGGGLRWAPGSSTDISIFGLSINSAGGILDTNGNNVTLSGGITGNGSMTKSGNGLLLLAGTNSYTGGTNLNGGTLQLTTNASLGGAGGLAINNGTIVFAASFTDAHAMTLNAASSVIQVDPTFTTTLNGVLSGNGTLVKTGNGILQVNAANTFSGGTSLNAGTVIVGADAGTLGSGDVTFNGGSLSITASAGLAGGLNIPVSGSLVNTAANATINGAWVGNGTLSMNGSFGQLTAAGSMAGFNGTLALGDSTGVFRFNTASNVNTGSGSATFDLGTGNASIISRNAGLEANLGALTGGANTTLGGSGNGTTTWVIGAKNVATTFSGTIVNGVASNTSLNSTNITKAGTEAFTPAGNNTYSGITSINGGTLVVSAVSNGSLETTGTIAVNTSVLSVADPSGLAVGMRAFGQNIPANTTIVSIDGTNVTLSANASANATAVPVLFGTPGSVGMATSNAANLVLNGGTFQYVGTGSTTNRLFTVGTSNGTIQSSGTGVLVLNNTGAVALSGTDAARTLTLSGSNTGNNTLAASIGDNGVGATSLVKNGAGKWILSGNNTYTGTTSVNTGRLQVNGSLGVTGVTVAGGAILSGNGTIGGTVTLQNGAVMEPGASVGTMTVAGLAVSTGATLNFEFNSTPANDMIVVTDSGGLSINGASGFNLYSEGTTNPLLTVGTFNLFSINGSVSGNLGLLTALNAPTGFAYSLSVNGSFVQVVVSLTQNPDSWNIATGGTWGLNTNWTFNTVPASGATVTFGPIISATSTVTLDGSRTVGGMIFSSENGYTIAQGSSGTLIFNNGSTIQVEAGTNTISAPMTITTGLTANTTTATALILSGNIGESGASGIVKNGDGMLTLSGTNSFTGGLVLNAGTVNLNSAMALGTGTLTIAGGNLDNTSGSAVTLSTNNAQLWNGDFGFAGTNALNLGTGTVTLGANRTVTIAAGNLTVGGIISGSGLSLTKAGNGTLLLTGANTYNGGTIVSGGTLQLGPGGVLADGGAVSVSGGSLNIGANDETVGTVTLVSGSIVGTGTLTADSYAVQSGATTPTLAGPGGLTKTTNAFVTLNGPSTYAGATVIENGTLALVGGDNRLPATTALTMGNGTLGGTLLLGLPSGPSNQTLTGLNTSGTGANSIISGNSSNSLLTLNITSTTSTFAGVIGDGTNAITDANAISILKTGNGLLTLSGVNTYAGGTNITGGTLQVLAASGLGFNDGTSLTAAHIGNATLLAGGTFTTNRIFFLDDPLSKISVSSGFTMTLGANASLLGSGSLNKEGAGILTLSGVSANYTYTGSTNVNVGTLTLGSAGLIPNASNLTIASGATFDMNNNADTVGNLAGFGNITLGNATLTANNTSSTTFGGIISGTGGFTKQGVGQLTFTGSNTFNGTTTVSLGTLRLGNGTADGSLASNVVVTTNLVLNNAGSITLPGVISGSGVVTKTGAGEATLSGVNTYTGATNVTAGTLRFNGNMSSNITVQSGATVGGIGTSNRTITLVAGSRLAPGAFAGSSIGNLTATSLTWNSDNATGLLWDLSTFDDSSDRLILTGNFIKGTGSVFLFDFQGTGYFDGSTPTTYTLVTFNQNVGFSANDFGYLNNPYGGFFSFVGNTLVITVPEPSTWALILGGAALGLAALHKRRRRNTVASIAKMGE